MGKIILILNCFLTLGLFWRVLLSLYYRRLRVKFAGQQNVLNHVLVILS